jgi:hypothetical protein
MKLGDNLQAAKLYLQYKGKTAKTAAKKFQGKTVAKLSSIDSKIKLTNKIKAIRKKITDRKTTIKITVNKDQNSTKIEIKGDKNFNLDGLASVLTNKSLEVAKKNPLLTDKPTDTLETPNKSKPDVPPRPSFSSKPAVPPRPAGKTNTNESLSKDQQSIESNITVDIPKTPPVPPVKTIKSTGIGAAVEKNITKDASRDNLLQEIKSFDPKKNLKKANTSNPTENTKLDFSKDLNKALDIRRKAINPDD